MSLITISQAEIKMAKRRVIEFDTKYQEGKGIKTLQITRTPFAYIGNDKYVITRKQGVILTEAGVRYRVVRYGYV